MNKKLQYARKVLLEESKAIASLRLDNRFIESVEKILNCRGKVITTGMGKAGLVARKISATLCATGTQACFLHPGDAGHGDLGIIGKKDILIVLSNSGKTREVREVIKWARELKVDKVIGITADRKSDIGKSCNIVIQIGKIKEACPFNLSPTCSTTAMLALGDALAMTVMKYRDFEQIDYFVRHHDGYIGQQLERSMK